ncbi:hypothetical protein GGR03_000516 [Aurantimonas endophytica]|uniref:DUF1849 family protein n=2 Tax=Aurantimonas endophytica TaxID=1522175 RepID=A0A7W6HA61_9HYPH|nr:DUF1849 family protein [Aurantimonas endophytica]MBB4001469.1 hypothetical protein [Aurantimonas endophytica]MCO6402890.1 DUF1849 family protein [Aurantimonas endophytica]
MRVSSIAFLMLGAGTMHAASAELALHRASYDLALSDDASDMVGAEGRIAVEISGDCDAYDLDYRFVARFQQEQELIVTDQQTESREARDGSWFEFETKTFVDSSPQDTVSGTAATDGGRTTVTFTQPGEHSVEVPRALFPMQHTRSLIEKAEAGERIVETALFDGDDDPQKELTSTAIIGPGAPANATGPDARAATSGEGAAADRGAPLAGLRSWRVSESFYNSDSDADGMPVFETAYTLYENGVSDDLVLRFDGYALSGSLASLDLLDRPDCP